MLLTPVFLLLAACVDPAAPIDPDDDAPLVVEVPKGATAGGMGPTLVEHGLVSSELQWKVFLKQVDATCLKAGRFEVKRTMSLQEVVDTLCGPPLADDVPFTVVEGWRIRDIDAALAAKGLIEAGAYAAAAKSGDGIEVSFPLPEGSLEGYLYPETYKVSAGAFSPERLVARQVQTFDERFASKHTGDLGGRTLHELVVMASMLEREEPNPSNRPVVAGILWKRIDHDTPLGVDATSRYTLDNWNDRSAFLKNLRDPDEPYNTRLRKGLPPTAIGNPTVESLEAALAPVPGPHWYYLHDAQGNLHPARNAEEHEANRKKYNVY